MNLEARYKTTDLISLFTELQDDGYTGMNLKLILDLIEWRLEAVDKDIKAILVSDEGI